MFCFFIIADLIQNPSRREILIGHHLIDDVRDIFGDRICEILQEGKYLRSRNGQIEGYGKNFSPKKKRPFGRFPIANRHPPPINGLTIFWTLIIKIQE